MKTFSTPAWPVALLLLTVTLADGLRPARAASGPIPVPSETSTEFQAVADVNGDGHPDQILVDKATGIYRVGYGAPGGTNAWADGRSSGVEAVTGFAAGRVLVTGRDALVLTAPAANRVNVLDASSPLQPAVPVNVFLDSLGPDRVVALDLGGAGNTLHDDLFTTSVENGPGAPHRLTLSRSTGASFPTRLDTNLAARVVAAAAVRLSTNGALAPLAGVLTEAGPGSRVFTAQSLASGVPVDVAKAAGLPDVNAFLSGSFGAGPLTQFLFYREGWTNLLLRPVIEPAPGAFAFGTGATFAFGVPLRQVVAVQAGSDVRLVILFGDGSAAGVYAFDGVNPPELMETREAGVGERFTGVLPSGSQGDFTLLSGADGRSTRFQDWRRDGEGYRPGAGGVLPAVNPLAGAANVFLFAERPFVHPAPRLLGSLNAADWSSRLQTTNPPGQVTVWAERFRGSTEGLGQAGVRVLGAAPAGAAHGLANQLASSYSLLSFSPAIGAEVVDVTIAPAPGPQALGVAISFRTPPGTNALVHYRLGADQPWKIYLNQPVPLFRDTTVTYYAAAGGRKSSLRTARYTFARPPAELDTDGDGVPDFVELALGGGEAGVRSKDTDGDGYSDLAEILAGTNGPPGTVGRPYDGTVAPTNAPRADELAAFDWVVMPRAATGHGWSLASCATGTVVRAYDLQGGLLGTRVAEAFGNVPAAWHSNLFADVTRRFYVAATPSHFDLHTNSPAWTSGADVRVGRELLGLLPVPAVTVDLPVAYAFGNGTLEAEAAAWIAAAQAAQAAVEHPVAAGALTPDDTLVALLCERKLAELLVARGLMDPGRKLTLFPFRPQDAGRWVAPLAALRSLETNAVLAGGTLDLSRPGHALVPLHDAIRQAVTNPPTAEVSALRALAAEVYRISAASNNAAPGVYAGPVDVLRGFFEQGILAPAYGAALDLSATDPVQAAAGAGQVLAAAGSRPYVQVLLRVRADSFGPGCVVLETLAGERRSLVLPDGSPWKFPVAFQLIAGSLVEVTAYTDGAPACGVPALEVVQAGVCAFPAVSPDDANGNLLADAWEDLYQLWNGTADEDGDGSSNLKEFLDGTDPRNAASAVSGPGVQPPSVAMAPEPDGRLKFRWSWPEAYAARMEFRLVSVGVLGDAPTVEPGAVQALGGGEFQILLPAPSGTTRFYRLQMTLR